MTEREQHLDRLADEFIGRCEWSGESYFGLDGKRPWGSSADSDTLSILGIHPEIDYGDDVYFDFSDRQLEYARGLMRDLPDHLRRRWAESRGRAGS